MQFETRDLQVFQLKHYGLRINSACYLVTVSNTSQKEDSHRVQDLPDWVFTSKHAVWLTEEEEPIADRARNGDEIRKQLFALRNNHR